MKSIIKPISIIISLILLFFFIIIVFFVGNNNDVLSFDKIKKVENGVFSLEENKKISDDGELNKVLKENIDFLDKIYSVNYEKFYKLDKKNNKIKIGKGIFLFNLQDILKNYTVENDFYSIKSLGNGLFFVNNTDPRNIIIYNFDQVLEVSFFSGQKIYKKINIFPHTFLAFSKNQVLNKSFEKGDTYRIMDFIKYKYQNDSYLVKENKKLLVNKNFFSFLEENSYKRFLLINKEEKLKFFEKQNIFLEKVLNDILKTEEENKKVIEILKNSQVGNIYIIEFFKKYSYLFLNDKKIEIYKKNKLLKEINNLFFLKAKNLTEVSNEILQELKELEKIDKASYKKFTQIIKSYYLYLINSNNIEDIENKKVFFDLIKKIENKNIDKDEIILKQNFETLNSIYHSKDFYKIDNISFINNFNLFSKKFLQLNSKNSEIKKYYTIFLFEFLKDNLTFESGNIKSYIDLLGSYTKIKDNSFRSKKQLEQYTEFLSQIKIMIQSNFFEKNRDEKSKLIFLENRPHIDIETIESLENVIDILIKYVDDNLDLLEIDEIEKDKNIYNNFTINKEILKELISALKDPLEYKNSYKNNFESILEQNKDITKKLSLKKCREYFEKNFSGLDLTEFKCGIKDNKYIVKDIKFDNKKISFTLNPSLGNTISDIVLFDGEKEKKLKVIYSLDDRKQEWELRKKHLRKGDEKYDFANFFQNTFSAVSQEKNTTEKQPEKKVDDYKENSIVIKLKRTRLLGENGELSYFKGKFFKTIDYKKVKVYYKNGGFDIYLEKIPFYVSYEQGKTKKKIFGVFSAQYVLNNNNPYFKNIKIEFLDKKGNNVLDGNYLKVVGKIYYNDFEEKIKSIVKNYDKIYFVYNKIKAILKKKKVIIKYNLIIKTLEFYIPKGEINQKNIDLEENSIKIIITGDKIKSIKNIYEELIEGEKKPSYKEIDIYLESLTQNNIY